MSMQVSYKKQFTFFVIISILLLGVVEIISNIWWLNQISCEFENSEIFENLDSKMKKNMCNELYNIKTLGNELVPNQKSESININSHGFRGPEFSVEKESGTLRIFIVGGSTVFGMGATNDNTTIPGYIQSIINEKEIDEKIEIINAGIQKSNSKTELALIENKILKFKPDFIVVYDGWNDLRERFDSQFTLNNWQKICENGKKFGFQTIMVQQPIAGFSEKKLTETELYHAKNGVDYEQNILTNQLSTYNEISIKLNDLEVCENTLNLRNIFDEYEDAIYWDQGHVSDKGNFIVAKEISNILSSKINNTNSSIYEEKQEELHSNIVEENNYFEILSNYKTPIMLDSIFNYNIVKSSQIQNFEINLQSGKRFYENNELFISMDITTTKDGYNLEIKTVNSENEQNFKNVTYFITIQKNGQDVLRDHFVSVDEILKINIIPKDIEEIKLTGFRNYEFYSLNDDLQPIILSGPIMNDLSEYNFIFHIRTLNDTEEWIFNLENFQINFKLDKKQFSNNNVHNNFQNEERITEIDSFDYIKSSNKLTHFNEIDKSVLEWKQGKISDDDFLKKVDEQFKDGFISKENSHLQLPSWLKNNAGSIAKELSVKNTDFYSNYDYLDEEIYPCYDNGTGVTRNDCWDYKFNSNGLRNLEVIIPKPDDVFRIIAIGGSTTFGGEKNDTTWPGHLERILNELVVGKKIEVINAGKPGINSGHEFNYLRNEVNRLEPDLVLMYDGWNDSINVEFNETLRNWDLSCKLGYENDYHTYIIIQPLPTYSNRVLTNQEINSIFTPSFSSPLNYKEISINYLESLLKLGNQCSRILDLRWIFDYIYTPIFYDGGHVMNVGNKIIAENIANQISEDFFGINNLISYNKLNKENINIYSLYAVGVDFNKKDFKNLNLSKGIFDRSNFSEATLYNTDLENSRLIFVNMTKSNLQMAHLSNADLRGADLSNADTDQSKMEQKWIYCNETKEFFNNSWEFPFDASLKKWLLSEC